MEAVVGGHLRAGRPEHPSHDSATSLPSVATSPRPPPPVAQNQPAQAYRSQPWRRQSRRAQGGRGGGRGACARSGPRGRAAVGVTGKSMRASAAASLGGLSRSECTGRQRGWGGSQRPSSPRCASTSWKSSTWWGAGRRPVAWRRIGRAEHALALWLACSAGTASAADSGAGQGAAAAPLKVGAGARGGHAHAPGRADGLLLPVHPCLEHARHQRGLLGWLQRVGVQGGWRQNAGGGLGWAKSESGRTPQIWVAPRP